MPAEIIERARQIFAARNSTAESNYADLVSQIVADQTPDPDDVVRITEAAGHSLEQLETDVATEETRINLRRQLEQEPALKTRAAKLQADYDAERAKYAAAVDAGKARLAEMEHAVQTAVGQRARLGEVRSKLLSMAPACYRETRQELTEQRKAALVRRDAAKQTLDIDAAAVDSLELRLAKGDQQDAVTLKADLVRAKSYVRASTSHYETLVAEVQSIDEQLEALKAEQFTG